MIIVYCLNSISETGGIENITIAKANALAEISTNQIYIIVTDYTHRWPATSLSNKVTLIDLDINYYKDDWKSKLHVLKGILIKRIKHKRKLKQKLNEINPDIVISVGQAEKYMLTSIPGKWKLIREFHYIKNYRLISLPKKNKIRRFIANLCNEYDFNYKISKYDCVVILTNEDYVNNWYNKPKIRVIPNFSRIETRVKPILKKKVIITAGRLEYPKNYSSLIYALKLVFTQHPDWKLEIYGDGSERKKLLDLIFKLNLEENVQLKGNCENLKTKLSEASIFTMTSRFEGFPLVMIEAMSCGLPVVTYDFMCGPRDVINNGIDGYIVSSGNIGLLAKKIIELIENENKRKELGENAYKRALDFSQEKIINKWIELFSNLTN